MFPDDDSIDVINRQRSSHIAPDSWKKLFYPVVPLLVALGSNGFVWLSLAYGGFFRGAPWGYAFVYPIVPTSIEVVGHVLALFALFHFRRRILKSEKESTLGAFAFVIGAIGIGASIVLSVLAAIVFFIGPLGPGD